MKHKTITTLTFTEIKDKKKITHSYSIKTEDLLPKKKKLFKNRK